MYYRRRDPVWVDGQVALLGDACHAMLPYQAQAARRRWRTCAVMAEELGGCGRGAAGARWGGSVPPGQARRDGPGRLLRNMSLYHLPDGPEQGARDEKLKRRGGRPGRHSLPVGEDIWDYRRRTA